MADIFISYASDDVECVRPLAEALASAGFDVWWDQELKGGARYSKVIEEEIERAATVLVIWSASSVESQWVADEAALARDTNKLLPVTLDSSQPPLGFRQVQSLDLSGWDRSPEGHAFQQLLASLGVSKSENVSAHSMPGISESTSALSGGLSGVKSPVLAIAGLAVVLVVSLVTWMWPTERMSGVEGSGTAGAPAVLSDRNFDGRGAIVVLPFTNLSGDPEQEYFSDGITEDLIVTLHSYRLFPIIARTSAFTYKNVNKDVPTIASELGAAYIIDGTVRRSGDQVRISAQLQDAGAHTLWAARYEVEWTDIYSTQDTIVASILAEIDSEILVNETDLSRHVRPEDMNAWDYYLKARGLTTASLGFMDINGQEVTLEGNDEARALLLKAIELEPDFAAAYALIMHVEGAYSGQLGMYVTEEYREAALKRSLDYGYTALRLNPFEAYACSCLALLLQMDGKVDEALRIQEAALHELPTNAIIHAALAKILENVGQFDRALKEIQTAKRLSPRDIEMSTYLYYEAAIHLAMGNFADAKRVSEEALRLSPEHLDAHSMRIMSIYTMGDLLGAEAALAELQERLPRFTPRGLWRGPLHPKVRDAMPKHMSSELLEQTIQEAFRLVIVDLGWDEGGS